MSVVVIIIRVEIGIGIRTEGVGVPEIRAIVPSPALSGDQRGCNEDRRDDDDKEAGSGGRNDRRGRA